MPIYEYRCADCGKKTTVVTLSVKAAVRPACRHCGGSNLAKLVSRVAVLQSEERRLERMADPSSLSGLDEDSPRGMARWMKKMGREMGEDLGDDFDDDVERAVEEAESREDRGEEGLSGGGPNSDED